MDIAELGEFNFIEHITRREKERKHNESTILAIGDDGAIIDNNEQLQSVISTDLLLDGVNFDLSYTPIKHLGYKSVVVGASDICAMGATPKQMTISLGITSRFSVEDIDEFYEGVNIALDEYGIDLVGGDTSASHSGLVVSITTIGTVAKGEAITRSGASVNEILCTTGDLGSAFLGLKLLECEKNVGDEKSKIERNLSSYSYLIQRALKPTLRCDILERLKSHNLTPTSMIDISDGLASEILHICKSSQVGARIYTDFLPIVEKAIGAGEELGIDPIIAAMNGGDDYELLFTLPLSANESVKQIEGIRVIGYTTEKQKGAKLVTPQEVEIEIKAQGHKQSNN